MLWWINHSERARAELSRGYVWTPRTDGEHQVNDITAVVPGDAIASYAATLVTHVGIVADYAIAAPDPASKVATLSKRAGWFVPVEWRRLKSAVRPKAVPELRDLLTGETAPLEPLAASSNPNVLFAGVAAEVFVLLREHSGGVRGRPSKVLTVEGYRDRLDDVEQDRIASSDGLSETEKSQLILARRGHGEFRRRVFLIEPYCRLTHINNPRLLVASHMKPWHACDSAEERLDGYNGLMLSPHVDWLFDRGLISFLDTGETLVSPFLNEPDLESLGLAGAIARPTKPFTPRQSRYLQFHREVVFLEG